MMPASRRYKVHPYAIKTHEVVVFCGGSTLAEFYSMADSFTTARWLIPSQPLDGFRFCDLEVVGLNASYATV